MTTTTTTTTYAPIQLPPLPTPIEPTDPKEYPLLHATLPSNLRRFPLVFPGGTRATFKDGDDTNDEDRESRGEGWRMLRRDDPPEPVVGLAEAVDRYGKKRAWEEEPQSRKKPRPPPSPPGSRQGSPFEPDLALTTLLTLPSLLSHFSALPPSLQSHFLLTLLRHSPPPRPPNSPLGSYPNPRTRFSHPPATRTRLSYPILSSLFRPCSRFASVQVVAIAH